MAQGLAIVLSTLVEQLKNEGKTQESRNKDLDELISLAKIKDNVATMSSHSLGLVELLIKVMKGTDVGAKIKATAVLWYFTLGGTQVNIIITDPSLGLFKQYIVILKSGTVTEKGNVLGALSNLAVVPECRTLLFSSPDIGLTLIQELVAIIKEDKDKARLSALGIMWSLTCADAQSRAVFVAPDLGLLVQYVEILKSDKGEARTKALGGLFNLALTPACRKRMTSPILGLLEQLVLVTKEDKDKARIGALGVLSNLSVGNEDDIKSELVAPSLGLLPQYVEILKSDKAEARKKVLGGLCNFSTALECKKAIVSPYLGLFEQLVLVIKEDRGDARSDSLSILWNLSCGLDEVKKSLITSRLGIMTLLVDILKSDKAEARRKVLGVLSNLTAVSGESRRDLGSPSLHLMFQLVVLLKEETGDTQMKALGCLWNLSIDLHNTVSLVGLNLEIPIIDLLKQFSSLEEEFRTKLLTVLMCFCRHPLAATAVRNIPGSVALQVLEPIAKQKDSTGLRALFIISQLVGKDEANSNTNTLSLLETRPETLDQIVDVLQNNIAGKDGKDYTFGNFDLNAVTSAVLSLSISDSNKKLMVKNPYLLLSLISLLRSFTNNDEPFKHKTNSSRGGIGGGGDDIETASYVIETLLQLSFYFADNDSLVRDYMTTDLGLEGILSRFVNIGSERKVGLDATRSASNLLSRLQRSSTPSTPSTPLSPFKTRQHIMLSYAWGANKDNVIHLQYELQRLGYEVWRDEVGSSLVPPMSGGVDERMAEAIEASYGVVICVSPQYKESANCQMEGKYCNSLFKKKRLKLFYVMMDSNYHTSSPVCVNGWLGIMIGDALWYPCWGNATQVASAGESLAILFGDNAKRQSQQSMPALPSTNNASNNNPSSSSSEAKSEPEAPTSPGGNSSSSIVTFPPSPPTYNTSSSSSVLVADNSFTVEKLTNTIVSSASIDVDLIVTKIKDLYELVSQTSAAYQNIDKPSVAVIEKNTHFEDVWRILTKVEHAVDPSKLAQKLSDLGLCECNQLEYLDEQEFSDLSSMLKSIPRKEFVSKLAKAATKI